MELTKYSGLLPRSRAGGKIRGGWCGARWWQRRRWCAMLSGRTNGYIDAQPAGDIWRLTLDRYNGGGEGNLAS